MIRKNLTNLSFQTFYVSQEQSNCPLVSDIVKIGKKFEEYGLLKNNSGVISLGYGKRILINGNGVSLADVKREDVLEIVDYDPVKKIVLAIGQKEPHIETPVHWIIHHARNDVNAIIQLNDENLVKKIQKKLLATEKTYSSRTLELAKDILKALRTSKSIAIKDKGALFVGTCLKEAEDLVLKTHGESK
jgi:hypothetical protein